jgi:hypothetical protein
LEKYQWILEDKDVDGNFKVITLKIDDLHLMTMADHQSSESCLKNKPSTPLSNCPRNYF